MTSEKRMTGREIVKFVVDNNALDCELVLAPNGNVEDAIDVNKLDMDDIEGLIVINMSEDMLADMGVTHDQEENDTTP